jgi:hypothetical protein
MERNYDDIVALIDQHPEVFDFGEYGSGVSEVWLAKAQERLQIQFPPSYVWWLKNYNGGSTFGDEIFSIYEMDFDAVSGGDIVCRNELDRKQGLASNEQLVFQTSDIDVGFYFDLSVYNELGEAPVFNMLTQKKYAEDFIDFLKKRVEDE